MDLKKLLSQINIDADWIGLREVREKETCKLEMVTHKQMGPEPHME